jgi:hypothetical protein
LISVKDTTLDEFFIMPENILSKRVNIDVKINSLEKGIDSLILKNATLYY